MEKLASHDVALGLLRLARELVALDGPVVEIDPVVDPAADKSYFDNQVCGRGLAYFTNNPPVGNTVTFYFKNDYPGLSDDKRSRIVFKKSPDGKWSYSAIAAGGDEIASYTSDSCKSCWKNLLDTLHSDIIKKMSKYVDLMRAKNGDKGHVGTCHLSDDAESGRCTAVFIGDADVKSESVSDASHEVFKRLDGVVRDLRDEENGEYGKNGKNVISFNLNDKEKAKGVIGQCGFSLTSDLDNQRG